LEDFYARVVSVLLRSGTSRAPTISAARRGGLFCAGDLLMATMVAGHPGRAAEKQIN
jgi:hypothetical protein